MLKCCTPNFPLSPLSNSHTSLFSPLSSSSSRFAHFLYRPTPAKLGISAHLSPSSYQLLAQIADAIPDDDGPIELDLTFPSFLATDDNPTTIQVLTSVLLTGAVTVFLFRSVRRRARRAKELQFRSTGAKKTLKEEALENLKAMTPLPAEADAPPSPVQALLGGLSAGIIALILFKFTTTIEASLNRQTISDNYSVRQITVTIRTIINGICYLATFVFGINALGLVLYAGQLAFNSIMGDSTSDRTLNKDEIQTNPINTPVKDSAELKTTDGDQNSDNMQ